MATGFRETVYVVPADETGSSTLAFGIYNHGRLPVKIVEVWPDADETLCFWTPSQRWFQDDPRYMGVLDDRAQPAEGAVLGPGRSATIWITGSHPNPARCVHAGMNVHDDVELTVRVLGRASTTHVPLGYTFGYSDDPTALRTSYEYRVLPPRPQSNG